MNPPAPSSTTDSDPRPISQQSVVELVIEEVRRLILEGSLRPGANLSITDLARRLEVSHIPVREALRRLETEGLIELRRSRSAVVADLSVSDVEQIFHLRTMLETDLLQRAIKVYTEDDLEACRAAWEALTWNSGESTESMSVRHVEFHRSMYLPALTDWDLRVGQILWQASERYIYLILGSTEVADDPNHFRDAHRDLLDAVLERSPRLVRKATAEHNAGGVALVTKLLAARGS